MICIVFSLVLSLLIGFLYSLACLFFVRSLQKNRQAYTPSQTR